MSDLHLNWLIPAKPAMTDEMWNDTMFNMLPNEDTSEATLILAGDLWDDASKVCKWAEWSWLEEVCSRYEHVVYTPGNHCLYNTTPHRLLTKLQEWKEANWVGSLHILDQSHVILDDIVFVGGTLWTDMQKENPLVMSLATEMMNDFRYIRKDDYSRWTPSKWLLEHHITKQYIEEVVKQHKDKKVVVVTHHAPLLQCAASEYAGNISNAYYTSDLSEFILDNENILFWVYGHIHNAPSEIECGNCLVLNNSYGYNGENPSFDRNACFIV